MVKLQKLGVAGIICACFVVTQARASLVDKTAAIVNADVVTLSDTHYFTKNLGLRRELDPFIGFFQHTPQGEKEIVNYLVQEVLIMQKLSPTKEDVDEEINAIQRNNKIDREKLKGVLASQGVNFDDYYALMKVSVAKRRLMDRELRPLSQVTDEEIKNYYYTAPEYAENKKKHNLTLSYNLEQLIIPTKELAMQIRAKLRQGDDFESIANSMTTQKVELNMLGMLPEEKLSGAVLKSIQGLRVGEYSEPIFTGSGYFILRIREISAPKDTSFEAAKEAVRNKLFQKAMTRHLESWTERERLSSYIYIP